MKQQYSNSEQLSFSIGRPLPVLIEEIQKTSRNQNLRKAAEEMLKALRTFELAQQAGTSKSARANQAIYELLTK